MKKLIMGLFSAILIFSCGGGGSSSPSTSELSSQQSGSSSTLPGYPIVAENTSSAGEAAVPPEGIVRGRFVASYIKGMTVCINGENQCTETDDEGNFSFTGIYSYPRLDFFVDGIKVGSYQLKEDNETITPFKLAPDSQTGEGLAKVIHALGDDPQAGATTVDLSGIKVNSDVQITSLVEALEQKTPFTLTVSSTGGTYQVRVTYPSQEPQVELCNSDGCQAVNYRQWLILVYMDADNDLNDEALKDLDEMKQVKFSPQVKLVVMADFLDQKGTVIAESDDETGQLKTYSYDVEQDMGSGYTLENFIKEYEDRYPAPKVALIFWDHGDGWRVAKIAAIDTTDKSYLYMYRIVNALKELQEQGYHLNLIGFDECLMGMAEVFFDVGQFADAVVASEALEPGTGWNYQTLLTELVQNPSTDPYGLGKMVVDAYRETYTSVNNLTMLVLSRDEINLLTEKINGLYSELNQDTYPYFQQARENATVVPDGQDNSLYHVDLYSLVKPLSGYFSEAREIASLIENSYRFTTGQNLSGISIYFPPDSSAPDYPCYLKSEPGGSIICFNDPYYYNPFAVNRWDEFLEKYFELGD